MAQDSSSFVIRNLNSSLGSLNDNFRKLSTGKRINSARDDAAGLAIVSALESSATVRGQSQRNISDAVSASDIAEGALGEISSIAGRLSELASQASNGTLSDDQRGALQQEYSQLTQEIQRIGATTEFNGVNLLDGSKLSVQVGTDSGANSQISTEGINLSSISSDVVSRDISNQGNAQQALDSVNSFINTLSSNRGRIGAVVNRLSSASSTSAVQQENELTAASRIRDADVAEETAQLTRNKILADAGTATLAQVGKLNSSRVQRLLGGA